MFAMPSRADALMLPLAFVCPASTSCPFDLSVRSPACAASTPLVETPTPYSFDDRKIRLAYIPPSALTSIATDGAAPLPAMDVALSES